MTNFAYSIGPIIDDRLSGKLMKCWKCVCTSITSVRVLRGIPFDSGTCFLTWVILNNTILGHEKEMHFSPIFFNDFVDIFQFFLIYDYIFFQATIFYQDGETEMVPLALMARRGRLWAMHGYFIHLLWWSCSPEYASEEPWGGAPLKILKK